MTETPHAGQSRNCTDCQTTRPTRHEQHHFESENQNQDGLQTAFHRRSRGKAGRRRHHWRVPDLAFTRLAHPPYFALGPDPLLVPTLEELRHAGYKEAEYMARVRIEFYGHISTVTVKARTLAGALHAYNNQEKHSLRNPAQKANEFKHILEVAPSGTTAIVYEQVGAANRTLGLRNTDGDASLWKPTHNGILGLMLIKGWAKILDVGPAKTDAVLRDLRTVPRGGRSRGRPRQLSSRTIGEITPAPVSEQPASSGAISPEIPVGALRGVSPLVTLRAQPVHQITSHGFKLTTPDASLIDKALQAKRPARPMPPASEVLRAEVAQFILAHLDEWLTYQDVAMHVEPEAIGDRAAFKALCSKIGKVVRSLTAEDLHYHEFSLSQSMFRLPGLAATNPPRLHRLHKRKQAGETRFLAWRVCRGVPPLA